MAGTPAWPGGPPPAQDCRPEIVPKAEGARRSEFLAWLKAHAKDARWDRPDLLEDQRLSRLDLRIADVDNDGAEEYVLTVSEGSLNVLSLWVFEPGGGGFQRVEKLPFEEQALLSEYRGPRKSEPQLLVRLCGKTYVNFAGGRGGADYHPASFVWERGGLRPACDSAWLRHRRREFQALFDARRYDDAHGMLDGVQAACASTADLDTWLWLQSDAALTAFRMKAYDDCLAHVDSARKRAGASPGGATVRKALDRNAALCAAARNEPAGGAAAYDFSWLRALEHEPDRQVVLDPRFDGLLSALVPDFAFEDGQSLRDAVRLSVWLPEPAEFVGGRYLVLSGCEPHNCENKGLIFIDLAARTGIVLTGGVVASRTTGAAAIPPEFWARTPFTPGEWADYVAPGGEKTRLAVPDVQP